MSDLDVRGCLKSLIRLTRVATHHHQCDRRSGRARCGWANTPYSI